MWNGFFFLSFVRVAFSVNTRRLDELEPTYKPYNIYGYHTNGANWHGFCRTGSFQSPVMIEKDNCQYHLQEIPSISEFTPREAPKDGKIKAVYYMDWKNLEVSPKTPGEFGFTTFEDRNYDVSFFRFHSGAEHCFEADGNYTPLQCDNRRAVEAQIVHHLVGEPDYIKGTPLSLSVVATWEVTENCMSDFWKEIRDVLRAGITSEKPNTRDASYDLVKKMILEIIETNNGGTWITYGGSWTTPPCTEKEQVILLKEPGCVPEDIYNTFQTEFGGNWRVLQNNPNEQLPIKRYLLP